MSYGAVSPTFHRRQQYELAPERFQSIAIDHELAAVARDQMLALELDQMFGDSRPRRADQFG